MIPRDYITEWRTKAPWVQDFHNADIGPLLAPGLSWDLAAAAIVVSTRLIHLLPGQPWKGEE